MNYDEHLKVLQILNAKEFIRFTLKEESLKYFLLKFCGIEEMFYDSIGGWCSIAWKGKMPDIEIYMDNIAKTVWKWIKRQRRQDDEGAYIELFLKALDYTILHEFIHWASESPEEYGVHDMCEYVIELLKTDMNMVWAFIPCPKTDSFVNLSTCLACDDLVKDASCPLYSMRADAIEGNREYETGKYHVSELINPRKAYYERLGETTQGWDEFQFLFLGKAIGWFVEKGYQHAEYEFDVPLSEVVSLLMMEPEPDDEEINILGHVDVLDFGRQIMAELKTIENTSYVKDEPKEDHAIQAKCYYTLGMAHAPELFQQIKDNRVVYISRGRARKNSPWYIEHKLGLVYYNFVETARMLHRAVKSGKAPPVYCPDWLCRYCDHGLKCREEKENEQ